LNSKEEFKKIITTFGKKIRREKQNQKQERIMVIYN